MISIDQHIEYRTIEYYTGTAQWLYYNYVLLWLEEFRRGCSAYHRDTYMEVFDPLFLALYLIIYGIIIVVIYLFI